MFEIPDDEDGFWETLPFDGLEGEDTKHYMIPSASHVVDDNQHADVTTTPNLTVEQTLLKRPLLAPLHINNTSKEEKMRVENSKGNGRIIDTGGLNRKTCKPGSKRKFPGPAGVLPESFPSGPDKSQNESPVVVKDTDNQQGFPMSQPSSSCHVFSTLPWQSLISDIGPDATSVLDKFSIKAMLLKARKKALPKGKIPLVLAFIDSVDFHGCDGSMILRDPSGKVQGALHQDLIKDPSTALRAGCVIVLRQASVISPSQRTHYLNITPANIVLIYSHSKDLHSAIQKSPWSPTLSLTPQPLPPMSQIIQESEKELTSALYRNKSHQDTNRRHSSHTPGRFATGSPSSLPPLGNSSTSTNNTALFSCHVPPPLVCNSNRFKSPVPFSSHATNNTNIHPISTAKNYPIKLLVSSSFSRHPNTTKTPSPLSATATQTGINDANTRVNIQRPSIPKELTPSSLRRYNPTLHPQNVSILPPTRSQTKPLDDEFLGDDSDLLSLCDGDDDDLFNRNTTSSANHVESLDTVRTLRQQVPDQRQTNSYVNSTRSNDPSPPLNNPQKTFNFENTSGLISCVQRYAEPGVGNNVGGVNFVTNRFSEMHESTEKSEPTFIDVMTSERQIKKNGSVFSSCDGSGRRLMDGGGGGRDARVQLGKSVVPAQRGSHLTSNLEPYYGTWDDDLSDDLLSQL